MTRPEAHLLRHPALPATPRVLRPFLREEEPLVHQGVLFPRRVSEVYAYLAAVYLPEAAARRSGPPVERTLRVPLPFHADRLVALLLVRRRVDHDDAVRLADRGADLVRQLVDQRRGIPRRFPDEVLHGLSAKPMKVGDGLGVLGVEVGQQALNIAERILLLLRTTQLVGKGPHKLLATSDIRELHSMAVCSDGSGRPPGRARRGLGRRCVIAGARHGPARGRPARLALPVGASGRPRPAGPRDARAVMP